MEGRLVYRTLIVFISLLCSSCFSFAGVGERTVSRLIRGEGFWCRVVTDIRPALHLKKGSENPVIVTCDDGSRFEQYLLVFTEDNKLVSVEKR